MFGVGWTEMLLIGIVALVVIGPKDLPVVMNRLGKVVATIRRMGGEFQRELNKTTGLDQITDLRRSITEPLKQTAAEITREFNKPLEGGGTAPTGVIAPKTPGAESVVDEIHEKVGMSPVEPGPIAPPAAAATAPAAPAKVESPAPVEAIAPANRPARKPRARKVAPAAPAIEPVKDTPAAKPKRRAAAASAASAETAPPVSRKRRTPKKTEG
jgi:sec-independent protein translocase protein TatB